MNKNIVFAGSILLIIFVLGGFIMYQERILQTGQTVILATRPVDPRDLFRGEYVILRYVIESDALVQGAVESINDGESLYIGLVKNEEGVAVVNKVQKMAPDFNDGLWVIGEVSDRRVRFPSIEQFYVPEGAGKGVESLRSDLHVEVVLKDGQARAVRLLDKELNPIDPKAYINHDKPRL